MDNWQLAGQILASLVTSRPTTAQWESLGLNLDIMTNIDLSLYCPLGSNVWCALCTSVFEINSDTSFEPKNGHYLMLKYKVVCSF